MVSRTQRIVVVLDTNVLVRALLSRSRLGPNQRVLRLWLVQKRLQLVVCHALVDEYLEILGQVLLLNDRLLADWEQRFLNDSRSTVVNLGPRFTFSRDPDDNLLLATAAGGRAEFLISNDGDLLDIEREKLRRLPFQIMSPAAFLGVIDNPR